MMIINTETLEIESPRQVSQATGIPLPRNPPAETLAQLTPPRAYVVESEPPQGDVVEPAGFEQGEDGAWRQAWSVREFTAEERAAQLEQARADALARLNADYDAAARPLLREYPEIERLSWGQQQREAEAYRAWQDAGSEGDAPATPALAAILDGRNGNTGDETLAQLVAAVLARAEAFIAWQTFTGIRQRGEWAIADAQTPEEARGVTWEGLVGG
ncbi:hypothetical protein QO259_05700 [Salinicola sp. JS01]|uniref:hypothetical protein n=1 Tax=Salinicola sp. JS01 TaxID=3050071 RepID=UPI00255B76C2|nr:hypothetical protein [Salinicola sp. JS01]WIX34157.1 hypothetical protein QO259_05700 [Salinicola sp. JS01]